MGNACFGESPFPWSKYGSNHDATRDLIESILPGFSGYNSRVRQSGGFYLPNGPRDGPTWNTPTGKASMHVHRFPERAIPDDRFVLMTVRSHDQYNTTVYGMDDRYRGVYNARRIVMMNPEDMEKLGSKVLNPLI